MTIIYLYIVISQQTSIHLRILNYEKLQTLDVINCTKNAKILHVSWQTGCIYNHSSETHTFSLLCLSPAEICRGRNMSHNTISCAYSNCRQGHRYIHKNKPKRGKGNRKKKKKPSIMSRHWMVFILEMDIMPKSLLVDAISMGVY